MSCLAHYPSNLGSTAPPVPTSPILKMAPSNQTGPKSKTRTRPARFRFKAPHRTPRPFSKAEAKAQTHNPSSGSISDGATPNYNDKPSSSAAAAADEQEQEIPFGEALFDALADADSAAYWAGVYGQPIHIYPRPNHAFGPVSDEDYIAYVQGRLWANTTAGMVEAAAARARAREKAAAEREAEEYRDKKRAARASKRAAAAALRQEQEQEQQAWNERCVAYLSAWEQRDGIQSRSRIPWPFISYSHNNSSTVDDLEEDDTDFQVSVSAHDIETFFTHLARMQDLPLAAVVKAERVRWHPDKIVQRFGGGYATERDRRVMARVNEVWRAIDEVWKRVRD